MEPIRRNVHVTLIQICHLTGDNGYYKTDEQLRHHSTIIIEYRVGCADYKTYFYKIGFKPRFTRVYRLNKRYIEDYTFRELNRYTRLKFIDGYEAALESICLKAFAKADTIEIQLLDNNNNKSYMAAGVINRVCERLNCFDKLRTMKFILPYCMIYTSMSGLNHTHLLCEKPEEHVKLIDNMKSGTIWAYLRNMNENDILRWIEEWMNEKREITCLAVCNYNSIDWLSILSRRYTFVLSNERELHRGPAKFAFLHRPGGSGSLWCQFDYDTFTFIGCCNRKYLPNGKQEQE